MAVCAHLQAENAETWCYQAEAGRVKEMVRISGWVFVGRCFCDVRACDTRENESCGWLKMM